MTENTTTCETCFRIVCKRCSWVATDQDVQKIQQGILISCPDCGWQPGDKID